MYIPLIIIIHDCNAIALNRIFLDTHFVLAGKAENILNGGEVKLAIKHSSCPPLRTLHADKIICYETTHLYETDIQQSHCNRSEPMTTIASNHVQQ